MSSETPNISHPVAGENNIAIRATNLSKCYHMYAHPRDRLKQFILPLLRRLMGWAPKQYFQEFWSLKDVSFEVKKGETLGIIGKNGAGKSTLLQTLCGTLTPTSGTVEAVGRVAALLELGAGFNPEFTGRENIYMNASVLGLSQREIKERIDEIISFADIGLFIDQPVKTYSSGMYVRLAFSIATSVDPDILVIDEALSVGDGAFSRKSFDRIMKLRDSGKTILFCSHSLYQIEAICNRAIWLKEGEICEIGSPAKVVMAYNSYLSHREGKEYLHSFDGVTREEAAPEGVAMIKNIVVSVDGVIGKNLTVISKVSNVEIQVDFIVDRKLEAPSVAVVITDMNGRHITSAGTANENLLLSLTPSGMGSAKVIYKNISLLKGMYWVYVFLMCEKGVHTYQMADMVAQFCVEQSGLEVGVVSLPHVWLDNKDSAKFE